MSKQIGIPRSIVTALAAAAFVAAWSSGFVIPATMPVDVSWITLLVWRFVLVAAVLAAVATIRGWWRGMTRTELSRQAVVGLFAQAGYCVFVYAAVGSGVAVGTTALIDAVQPLVVATLVGPLLELRVRGAQWAGLGVGAVGVAFVVASQVGGSADAVAYAFPVLAMACLVAGTFLQRRTAADTPVVTVLTIHVGVTAVVCVLLGAVTGSLTPPTDPAFWLSALLAAAFPTLAAYGLYWWLLRRVGITALNAFLFLIAPATALAGAVLLGEPLTAVTLVGFALCGAGVAVVLLSERRTPRVTPRPDVERTEIAQAAPTARASVAPASSSAAIVSVKARSRPTDPTRSTAAR